MQTPLDYTTMRLHKKIDGGKIEICPRCNRKGRLNYTLPRGKLPGFYIYAHKGYISWAKVITDHCTVSDERKEE